MKTTARAMAAGVVGVLWASWAAAATISGVSPQGVVAQAQQVVVRFDTPVVAASDGRQADPASVSCQGTATAGSGYWASPQQWVYNFREMLPPGVRCEVAVRPDWKPLGGALTGTQRFAFQTGGPVPERVQPSAGSEIEEDQHFLIQFNGSPTVASVAASTWCEAEGIGERIGTQIVTGAARDAVLRQQRRGLPADRWVLLRCARPLAQDQRVRLVVGPGVAAANNPALVTRSPMVLEYRVRKAFTAELSCERERAQAPCLPIRPVLLRFSSPVPRELAQQARVRPAAGGAALAPVFDKDDRETEVYELRFAGPLTPQAAYVMELPAALKDSSGRALSNAARFPLSFQTSDAPPIAKFAAAPFGILERLADPALPVTLRHVQGDLRPSAASGQVRVQRLDDPLQMLKAYAKVQQWHETQISAKQAGWPRDRWMETVEEKDERGRTVKRQVERLVATRELSLLTGESSARRLDLPGLQGGDPRPFEVVGIPLPEPGLHVVEIESSRLGEALLPRDPKAPVKPMFVRTAVLVTNLAVHVKLGRVNSLVWVTSLDRAKPVADADVQVLDCAGKPLWQGRTDAQGRARVDQTLQPAREDCLADPGFFVSARKADSRGLVDTAFVFSNWSRGIETWRFNLAGNGQERSGDLVAHTVMDRSLLRAGDTLSMKHLVRLQAPLALQAVAPEQLPTRLRITHEGSGEEHSLPLTWTGSRHALSQWTVPAAAKLGRYQLSLERDAAPTTPAGPGNGSASESPRSWPSGEFRVEAFRVPLIDARLVAPKEAQVAPRELSLAVQMNYAAGGAMGQAPLRGTAQWSERSLAFEAYPDFSFAWPREPGAGRGPQAEGAEDDANSDAPRLVADRTPLTTDTQGAARWTIPLTAGNPSPASGPLGKAVLTRPGTLRAELSYNDPNGEVQTVSTRVPTWPSAVVLGLRAGSWVSARGSAPLTAIALGIDSKPLAKQRLRIQGRQVQTLTTRKRMVGGFYAYDNRTETRDLGEICQGSTDAQGLFRCEARLEASGEVELWVSSADDAGRESRAAASLWVTRQGELWFEQDNDDRIDVLANKLRYEPGQTARLQVRTPYREATALLSVERDGIIDARLVTLRGDDPTVDLPIQPEWGPNVTVSVLALRGRVRDVPWYSFFQWGWKEPLNWVRAYRDEGPAYQAPTAMVDLSKPSAKLGAVSLKVGWAAHELQVQVSTDASTYKIRGKAVARIRVTGADGKPAAGAEVAFAAVDEGLLALQDNRSWQVLQGLIRERAWDVQTATGLSEVIGRRHYGRKAVPAGGGGGRAGARELFDTLLVWKPVVTLDAQGEATVDVPLNDSLTRFRLVAVADDGGQRFGTGQAEIRVTQDLQVLAGLPPLVREGDRFQALVTVRNTTSRALNLRASLAGTAEGGSAALPPTPAQTLSLPADSARELVWTIDVPQGATRLTWEVAAEETDAPAGAGQRLQDRVRHTQRVEAAVPVRVLQASLQQLDGSVSLPVAPPTDGLSLGGVRRGGLVVSAQARLSQNLPALRAYFERYPYTCLEQQASRAIGLNDAALWAAWLQQLPAYLDSDGLASYFPPSAGEPPRGSDSLTAYLLSAAFEAGLAIPEPALGRMVQGLTAFVTGRIERRFWSPQPDLEARKLAALAALARHGKADARMLGSIRTQPDAVAQWPTAALIDALTLTQRLAPSAELTALKTAVTQQLRTRLDANGATLSFNSERQDGWWWLMDSKDSHAAKLILAVSRDADWRADVPRLVAGHLGRQQRGQWSTTTANVWSVLALQRFSAQFEADKPSGETRIGMGDGAAGAASQRIAWAAQPDGGSVSVPWPAQSSTLRVQHEGAGKPWLSVQTQAAIPLTAPLERGYSVTRSLQPVQQKTPGRWTRGDIVRVRLQIQAQADMSWAVLSDPVPAGATVLGSGLGGDASIATTGERSSESAWVAYDERAAESFRRYFGYLPRGSHVVEYTLRLNNPGRFVLPPTRVEAMYAPERFGEAPNGAWEVVP